MTGRPCGNGGLAHNRRVDRTALRDELLAEARARGFSGAGIASVRPFRRIRARALAAIAEGRMATMTWYSPERVEASTDLSRRHPWARSLLALAWPYPPASVPGAPSPPAAPGRPRGRFAAYACLTGPGGGAVDYHDHLAAACDGLVEWLRERAGPVRAHRFVDHGWAIDRAVAERAGLGFAGKNACLLTREAGSYVLLAEVLLSLPLPSSAPSRRGCGNCHACRKGASNCCANLKVLGVMTDGGLRDRFVLRLFLVMRKETSNSGLIPPAGEPALLGHLRLRLRRRKAARGFPASS